MIFEQGLAQARRRLEDATVPAWTRVDAAARWGSAEPHRLRHDLAALASLLGAAVMAADAALAHRLGAPIVAMLIQPVVVLVAAAVAVRRPGPATQLFARASWWTYLALAVAWSFAPAETVPLAGSMLAICTGFALIAAGGVGTGRRETAAAFDPIAFRGVLLVAMILALAQAQLLLLVGGVRAESEVVTGASSWVGTALLHVVAVFGLFRLRVWGLLTLPFVSLIAVLAAGFGLLLGSVAVRVTVVLLAVPQLVLPVPIFVAIWRGAGSVARDQELPTRTGAVVAIVAMLAAVIAGVLGGSTS